MLNTQRCLSGLPATEVTRHFHSSFGYCGEHHIVRSLTGHLNLQVTVLRSYNASKHMPRMPLGTHTTAAVLCYFMRYYAIRYGSR